MNIRVNKPTAASTVQKAILVSSVTGTAPAVGCVTIAGATVTWNSSVSGTNNFINYWADVTSSVSAAINALSAGISNIAITECAGSTAAIEGEALLVIFNDATAAEKTVIIMWGAQNPTGDNFSLTLATPIDPAQAGALLDMGVGIGFSAQPTGGTQTSTIKVNNTLLTSAAGGEDDGICAGGALITVGGIGDDHANPADPSAAPTNPRSDDELYNILPFITSATSSVTITTLNSSGDDNIFLAYFALSGAAIIGEGILASQTSSTAATGTNHTGKAKVLNSLGEAIASRNVTFSVTSGPNTGTANVTGGNTASTDANGEATFTYTGDGGAGTDNISACFTNSSSEVVCSNTLSFEWTAPPCANPTGGGSIAADQTGCNPFNPAELASSTLPSGHTGTLEYKWQISTTSSSDGFSDISSTNASTFDPPSGLIVDTWYRRIARVTCAADWTGAVISNAVKMTVTPASVGGTAKWYPR